MSVTTYSTSLVIPTSPLSNQEGAPHQYTLSFFLDGNVSTADNSITLKLELNMPCDVTARVQPLTYCAGTSENVQPGSPVESDCSADMEPLSGNLYLKDSSVTFLPLPSSFNHMKHECWAPVALNIQDWLIQVVDDPDTPEWQWGQDLFWLAFFAAHPHFLHGDSTLWDPSIPFDGPIVQHFLDLEMEWVRQGDVDAWQTKADLQDVWIQFQNHVRLMYYSEIVACST